MSEIKDTMPQNNEQASSQPIGLENAGTAELLAKITEYESIIKTYKELAEQMKKELVQKDNAILEWKTKASQVDGESEQIQKLKAQHCKELEDIAVIKSQSEDTLTKAKSIIFERTKVIKNQELQIEALNQQIESMKDVVSITKDLLEIRNLEVKQLETKIKCMEGKIGAEKERHDLMHKKLETMIRHNGELKREYETQLCLFTALRDRYSERELARDVVDDLKNDRTKETNQTEAPQVNGTPEDSSTSQAEPQQPNKESENINQEQKMKE